MNKKNFRKLLLGIVFIIPIMLFYIINQENKTKKGFHKKIHVEVYEINKGYGYKIISNNKVLIKQDHIPAISTHTPFYSPQDAEKVANLVRERTINGKSPYIHMDDLFELNINLANID